MYIYIQAKPNSRNNALINQIRKEKREQVDRELEKEKKIQENTTKTNNNNKQIPDLSDPNHTYYPRPNPNNVDFKKVCIALTQTLTLRKYRYS